MENYSKRKLKVTGQPILNTREVGYIRSKLRDEYYPKPKKEEAPADAKQEDKFEPFFEGENTEAASNDAPASTDSSDTSTPTQAASSEKPKREFKKGGGHGKSGPRRDRAADQQKNLGLKMEADEFVFENEANADVKELNKNFLYDYRFRQEKRPQNPLVEFDPIEIKRLKQFAQQNNMDPAELFKQLRDTGKLTQE